MSMKRKISTILVCGFFIFLMNQIAVFAEESVNDLQNKVDESNSKIDSNNDEINTQEQKVDELNEQIKDTESEIAKIRTSFAKNEKKQEQLTDKINNKQKEIVELQDELSQRMEVSASVLKILQRNRNVNYVIQYLFNDKISGTDKFRTINSLNQISVRSFQKVQMTAKLIDKVNEEQQGLEADVSELKVEQAKLKAQGQELLDKSNDAERQKIEIIQTITTLQDKNEKEKEKLLDNSGLLADYKNSGCSGDQVYGVDCAVADPQSETVDDVIKSYSNTDGQQVNTAGGSYVAKLKADPNANYIIARESGCDPSATNTSSGAYGICQALPGSKMATAGSDWRTNIETQAKWCDTYAISRYGSWAGARAFWDINNWF